MPSIPDGLVGCYDEAIDAQRNHLKIAKALINRGIALLKTDAEKLTVDDLAKAAAAIEKGTRMETRANEELIKLHKEKPR